MEAAQSCRRILLRSCELQALWVGKQLLFFWLHPFISANWWWLSVPFIFCALLLVMSLWLIYHLFFFFLNNNIILLLSIFTFLSLNFVYSNTGWFYFFWFSFRPTSGSVKDVDTFYTLQQHIPYFSPLCSMLFQFLSMLHVSWDPWNTGSLSCRMPESFPGHQ